MSFEVFRRKTDLSLQQARRMVEGALAEGRRRSLQPLTVVVLDAGGHIVSVDREDGAGVLRLEIALGKANAALAIGVSSGTVGTRTKGREAFVTGVTAASQGRFVPVPGGVLVLDAQQAIIGAVGISGDAPDQDEACVLAGITAADLTPGLDAARS